MRKFAEKLIERLEEYKYTHLIEHDSEQCLHCTEVDCENGTDCTFCILDKTKEIVKELAEEHKSNLSENLTSWIPCEERLPEEEGNYIVTFDDGLISSVPFYREDWVLWGDSGEPIAWIPLPEPYKGEEK